MFTPLELPCGRQLGNRLVKSAMSDSLGDGTGHPSDGQMRLYERWAEGGVAVAIIGEVQGTPLFVEKPGNLVLNDRSNLDKFRDLVQRGGGDKLWIQLGHAGALAFGPTSKPKGPSALEEIPNSEALTLGEIQKVPSDFAATAKLAKKIGFGGVQIHAAHGFLLSQFLSPLFNKRTDDYGGPLPNRQRLLVETIAAVRKAVGPDFPVAVKLNSSDQLVGGFSEMDALDVITNLDTTSIDLIDISGGTYFPGAKAASDGTKGGPYFLDFAKQARKVTSKPLMLTGGFKTKAQADAALRYVDVIGLARALVLDPALPNLWAATTPSDPAFPRFNDPPQEGGVTAWYTMRLTDIAHDQEVQPPASTSFADALRNYDNRDAARIPIWRSHFSKQGPV